jgi:N-methylhydantoinase A
LKELSVNATNNLKDQGVSEEEVLLTWNVDMRYSGQSHELSISLKRNTENLTSSSIDLFESIHEESFGYRLDGRKVEWVTVRVVAQSSSNEYHPYKHPVIEETSPIGERIVLLSDGESVTAEVYQRETLGIGQQISGPSIIEQIDTTTYISPGWNAEQQADGSLWIRRMKK